MFKKIKKRDGEIVEFDSTKITTAIFKAGKATREFKEWKAKRLTNDVLSLADKLNTCSIPCVEYIQDLIERVLLNSKFNKTAKAYIIYREQRANIRDITTKANVDLVDNYIQKLDWKIKENSNMCYSLQGLNNYISSDLTSEYWLNKIYPEDIRNAHKDGDIHIHDLGLLANYCCGWSLQDLLKKGFRGVSGKIACAPARHFRSALGQIVNFFYTLQSESSGAQAFSNFDTLLAPFVHYDNLDYKEVKQAIQEFVFNMNVPTRVGFQTPFTNITMDLQAPSTLKDQPVFLGEVEQWNIYSDFQSEMDMINEAFAEVMMDGDADGRVFTFPIPTYNITKDFDWDNPNLKKLWKMTGKYGIPYFSNFINSDMSPDQITSLCCRLRLSHDELDIRGGGLFGSAPLTGSSGVVTINLPRIGYRNRSVKGYVEKLTQVYNIAVKSLVIKRKILEQFTEKNLYPYSKYYLADTKQRTGKYWKNHFSTIGIIGMNESCLNLFRKDIGSKKGQKFAIKIMDVLRSLLKATQKETGDIFNLEATPGESCIVAESLVKTINGDIEIKDLVGSEVGVYSLDDANNICVNKAYNIRKTKEKTQIIRIIFDNDTFIDVTPNHPIAVFWRFGRTKWIKAEDLKINQSIKSLYPRASKDGRITFNCNYKRARINYEYFHNTKIESNSVIHHINTITNDDSKENLQKLTKSEHNKIHYNLHEWQHKKGECSGVNNHFYGKHHTDESKKKNSDAHIGRQTGDDNPAKRIDVRKKLSDIAKNKPDYLHSKWRKDIDTKELIKLHIEGKTYSYIAKHFNCTQGLIQNRLKKARLNHRVKSIQYLEKKRDVYNMDVENTECYYINDGILVHNCSYSLPLKDKKQYPRIICANEKEYRNGAAPYYSNSTQLPVNYTDDIFEMLDLQDELQTKYTGGTVSHLFLGEQVTDTEVVKNLIKKIFTNYKLPYLSLTPTFSVCPSHGYIPGRQEKCPNCAQETEVYSRVVGYLRPEKQYNNGKRSEFKDRKMYNIETM